MLKVLNHFTGLVLGRFLISGVGTTLLFFVLSYGLVRGGMTPFWGSLLAYGIAFGVGYSVQRNWTFQAKTQHGVALPRYLALQAGCALFSGGFASLAVSYLGATPLVMSVLTTGAAGLVSFILSKSWVFRADGA